MVDKERRIVAVFAAKNKAKGVMTSFRRGLDKTGQAMKRMAKVGAVMTVAAAAGAAYMVKRQMEAIDVIAKLSDRLGIATEDLVGLQHAASISGVSTEALNKSLDMFVRRLGEMTMGSGEAQRGLEMLGLTTEELIRLSPAEAMGIAADKINRLETQAEKAAAAYFLFGRAGAQLVTMFAVGSEGLREFQREAERLGLTFSRFDAAQIEAANDALTRARAAMTGLFRTAAIELAPYIEALADKFVDVATAGEGLGANVVNVFEQMSLAAIRFGGVLQGSSAKFKAFQAGALEGFAGIIELSAKLEKYSPMGGVGRLTRRIAGAEDPIDIAARYRSQAAELMEAAGREAAGTYGQENAVKRFYEGLRKEAAGPKLEGADAVMAHIEKYRSSLKTDTGPVAEQTEAVISAERKKMQALEKTIDEEIKLLGKLNEPRQHARMLIQYEAAAMEEFAGNAQKAAEATEVFRGKLEELEEAQKWEEVAKTMEKSFAGALERLSQDWRNYGEVARGVLREILMETMRIMMWRPAAKALAGGLQELGGSFAAALFGAGTGADAAAASAFSSPHGGPAFPSGQHGGDVLKTGLAVIHRGETYSGVNGNYGRAQIVINNTVSDRVDVEIDEYLQSDQRIIDVTMRAAETDGPYRRSIRGVS